MDDKNLRPYLAELVGTFAVVFLSAGAVVVNQLAQPPLGPLAITLAGLAYGLAYAAALAFTGTMATGGYLNPAVTLTLWVLKKIDGAHTLWLMLAQTLGATLAGGALRVFLGGNDLLLIDSRLGTPHLNLEAFAADGVTLGAVLKGIGVELGLTFLVVCAIFGTNQDPRARRDSWTNRLAALWIGLAVAACVFVGFGLTGAALNPARWFGPWIWQYTVGGLSQSDLYRDHMVYWIGPIVGALVAGTLYSTVLQPAEPTHAAPPPAEKPAPVTSTLYRAQK
jgi:MIP family channel proteins